MGPSVPPSVFREGGSRLQDALALKTLDAELFMDGSENKARIRREGFDPEYRRHVRDFNLKHPSSFRTLTAEEQRG